MFKLLGAIFLAGAGLWGVGQFYWQQPDWAQRWVSDRAAETMCLVQGGTFTRHTAADWGYLQMRAKHGMTGVGVGCMPDGGCVMDKNLAAENLRSAMLGWAGTMGGKLLQGNVLEMAGAILDTSSATGRARAEQAEATYCFESLGKQRRSVMPTAAEVAPN
jgi:hypothetical protein